MAAATWAVEIDWDKDGTFTDYTAYVDGISNGLDVSNGAAEQDGSYRSGSLSLSLRNISGEFNRNYSSAGTYGLMNERVPIRIRVTRSGTSTFWQGYITDYDGPFYTPTGVNDASWINIRCTGALAMLAEDEVSVTASSSYDVDGALAAVFDALGLTVTTDYVTTDSDQTIALYFATKDKAQQAIRDLVASEMGGALYETKSGVITFKPRDGLLHGSADATWGDDNAASPKVYPSTVRPIVRDRMADKVDVRTRQFQLGAGGTLVYEMPNLGEDRYTGGAWRSLAIPANQAIGPKQIIPNRALGFSGTPTSTAYLDYSATSNSDGTGSDVTGSLTVTLSQPFGSAWYYTLTNTSGSAIYLNEFRVRAVAITDGKGTTPGNATYSTPTGTNDATVGTVAWVIPGRIISDNASYTTATLTAGQTSQYLMAMAWSAAIPSAATIDGVAFEVECKAATQTTQALSARIIKAGTPLTTVTRTVTIGTTEAYKLVGSSADTWGTTLTPEDVNDPGFGVALYISGALADTYSVDHVRMTVYFSTVTGIGTVEETYTAELAIPGVKGGQRRTYSLPWVSDATKARDYAQQMLRIARYPEELLELTFPWGTDAKRDAMIAAELYQLIAYQDTSLGASRGAYVDDWYRIIGLATNVGVDGVPNSRVLLRPSYNYRDLDNIAWDDFNRANAAALGNTPTGKAWTQVNNWQILSNKARCTSSSGLGTFALTANVVAEVSLANLTADVNAGAGLVFRFTNTSNYWRFIVLRASGVYTWELTKIVSGSSTQVATGSADSIATAELRIIAQGSRIRGWYNRKLVTDVSDSANSSNTNVGIYTLSDTTTDFDDFYAEGL